MGEVSFRRARDEDSVVVGSMLSGWLNWPKDRTGSFREALRDDGHEILIAESEGVVVGVLHWMLYPDVVVGGLNSHILLLEVEARFRNRGVGSSLMRMAVEYAKERGALEMHVDTIYPEAVEFYRKRGFKDDGVMMELPLT